MPVPYTRVFCAGSSGMDGGSARAVGCGSGNRSSRERSGAPAPWPPLALRACASSQRSRRWRQRPRPLPRPLLPAVIASLAVLVVLAGLAITDAYRGSIAPVVREGIRPVPTLLNFGYANLRERWHLVGLAQHPQVGANEVNVKLRPRCRADVGRHPRSHPNRLIRDRPVGPNLETESIADIARSRLPQIGLGGLCGRRLRAISAI